MVVESVIYYKLTIENFTNKDYLTVKHHYLLTKERHYHISSDVLNPDSQGQLFNPYNFYRLFSTRSNSNYTVPLIYEYICLCVRKWRLTFKFLQCWILKVVRYLHCIDLGRSAYSASRITLVKLPTLSSSQSLAVTMASFPVALLGKRGWPFAEEGFNMAIMIILLTVAMTSFVSSITS